MQSLEDYAGDKGDLRYPSTFTNGWPTDWPPAFLFHFVYGVSIYIKYGIHTIEDVLDVDGYYYPDGIKAATDRAVESLRVKKAAVEQRHIQQKAERESRIQDGLEERPARDAFDVVFALWEMSANSEELKRAEERRDVKLGEQRKKENAKKVDDWRQSLV